MHVTFNITSTVCASQMSEQEMDEVITRSTHRDSMGSHSSYSLGKLLHHKFKNGGELFSTVFSSKISGQLDCSSNLLKK